jgi:myo-inositol-1(or 4)-monophosphatase
MNSLPLSNNKRTPLEIAEEAAIKSGTYIREHLKEIRNITEKGRGNFVSELDTSSERIIIDILKGEYPDFEVISEESFPEVSSLNYAWLIDPVDGTTNSIYNIPFLCVNIALVHHNVPQVAVTYDPLRNEIFTAESGSGAYLNHQRIRVNGIKQLEQSLILCDLGYNLGKGDEILGILDKLWGKALGIRILGSAALGLAYVAAGRSNLYFHRALYPWDIACGILLIKEAGGEIVDWEGAPAGIYSSAIVAGNHELNQEFVRLIG